MDADTDPWHGRCVLVTGCTGFLGSAVTRELLARGADVVGLVRDRAAAAVFADDPHHGHFHPHHGRAEDAARLHAAMAVHEVSAVFHLAATDAATPDRGTAAVLRAAGLYHPRMPVVVARPSGGLRLAEGVVPATDSLGVARFGELFGGGDRKASRVVPRTATGLLSGEPSHYPASGAPRDFVFVRDAARACLAVAGAVAASGRPLDLTFRSGWSLTDRDMAAAVADAFAGGSPDAGAPPENPLGWRPRVTFADALRETIQWYRSAGHEPLPRRQPVRRAA